MPEVATIPEVAPITELWPDPPRLLVEWSSPWDEFKSALRPALARAPKALAGEAPIGIFPYRGILLSWLLECLLLIAIIVLPERFVSLEIPPPPTRPQWDVIYYSGDELPQTQDRGGARSGKSEQAELRLAGEPDVTYVATGAAPEAGDAEWARRVAAHRGRRPAWWRTAETTDLAGVLASARGALLIDGIGTWLAAALDQCGWDGGDGSARLAAMTGELVAAWRQAHGYVVAVSDETGLGVVPATAAGRRFRDELGRLNQALAAESEETELVVAGRVLPLAGWQAGRGEVTVR